MKIISVIFIVVLAGLTQTAGQCSYSNQWTQTSFREAPVQCNPLSDTDIWIVAATDHKPHSLDRLFTQTGKHRLHFQQWWTKDDMRGTNQYRYYSRGSGRIDDGTSCYRDAYVYEQGGEIIEIWIGNNRVYKRIVK